MQAIKKVTKQTTIQWTNAAKLGAHDQKRVGNLAKLGAFSEAGVAITDKQQLTNRHADSPV